MDLFSAVNLCRDWGGFLLNTVFQGLVCFLEPQVEKPGESLERARGGIYSLWDAWRHAGRPAGVGICSHFVHTGARDLYCKQVVCIFGGSIEKRGLILHWFLQG